MPYIVTLAQQGNSVVAIGSGAFNLDGLTIYAGADPALGAVWPVSGYLYTGGALTNLDVYAGFTGPTSFGSGGGTGASTVIGDSVAIVGSNDFYGLPLFFLPTGYVSGTALVSGAVWNNASFASLGIMPGTYTWTWGTAADQSFTLMTASAVPEPATLGMFGIGMLLIGGLAALRRPGQRPTA
ncbi:MAG: PEP-CTERM sorting domain-containing protein [Rhodanobacter sp.]